MFMLLISAETPDELRDALIPPVLASEVVRRCWPDPRKQVLPLGEFSSAELSDLLEQSVGIFEAMGLPVAGLTDADRADVLRDFLAGDDPSDLRSRWETP